MNETKEVADFEFTLTKYQPVVFSTDGKFGNLKVPQFPTTYGPLASIPGDTSKTLSPYRGELKCWAVDHGGLQQVRWNHLSGTAEVFDPAGPVSWQYSAWAFRCLQTSNGGNQNGIACGPAGELKMDGINYDYCPQKLIGQFSGRGTVLQNGQAVERNTVAIASCNQDFRQDRDLYFTKLKFNVWNGDETKYTGAYQCMDGLFEGALTGIQQSATHFEYADLQTEAARFKVTGIASSVCLVDTLTPINGHQVVEADSGLVGVIYTDWNLQNGNGDAATRTRHGTHLIGLGDKAGFVKFDPQETIPERP
jgi:hypothetical protein